MNKRFVAGLFALMVMMLTFGSAMAGAPGDHPINGILLTDGLATSIPANSTLWFFVPYPPGYQVEIGLNAQGLGGVGFDVFTQDQAMAWLSTPGTGPMGRGAKNPNSNFNLSWSGRLKQGGNFLVLLKNTNPFPAQVTWGYRAWVLGWVPLRGQIFVCYGCVGTTGNWVPYDPARGITEKDFFRFNLVDGIPQDLPAYQQRILLPTTSTWPIKCDGGIPCVVFPGLLSTPQGPQLIGEPISPLAPQGTYTIQDLFGDGRVVSGQFVPRPN
jgi:hypothetical protein